MTKAGGRDKMCDYFKLLISNGEIQYNEFPYIVVPKASPWTLE